MHQIFGAFKLITIFAYQLITMGAFTIKIKKEDIYKMERSARRNAEIELQLPRIKHSTHKSKKDYNRQELKKMKFDY